MEENLIRTEETLEFACVVKTICDEYDVDPQALRIFPPANNVLSLSNQVRFKKRLVIKIPIPKKIAPKTLSANPHLRISSLRNAAPDPHSLYGSSSDHSQLGRLGIGLGEFELTTSNKKIRFWVWNGAQDYYIFGGQGAYFVHQDDVLALTFFIKRAQRRNRRPVETPILPSEMMNEIYKNSVGFLLKGRDMQEKYAKYRIPYKRGILLSGRPGCGKTMSCRWLRELCEQNNLAYRVISMEDYREATHRGGVRRLFKLRGKRSGIIFFDDMDVMVRDRNKSSGHELSTFLSELDGLDPADGVVYVFTTNYIKDLDEAFVRPGRIDLWLPFQLPTAKLRKKFIDQRFDEEIKEAVDTKDVLERTKDYSFAELEEIRKLFCMELIDEKPIDVDATFKTFDKHRKDFEERAMMGFTTLDDDSDDDDGYDDEIFPEIFIPRRYK